MYRIYSPLRATLTLVLALGISIGAWAQTSIQGRIADEGGTPLIGATILAIGTNVGTATDIEGNFSLTVPEGVDSLLVSYVGYDEQLIEVGDSEFLDIQLLEGLTLDVDIVVSGQGVGIERKRITTAIDKVSSRDLEVQPVTQVDQLLQAKLTGTQIRLSSGQPGTASLIRNRGPISASGATTPVIIIDGVRVDNLNANPELGIGTGGAQSSAIADIPVESIESVEFIPGGAATTLYGADAANGVLQIFTKKGTAGPARFTLETNLGFNQVEDRFFRFPETKSILFDDPGTYQQYRAGVDGGNEKVTYNFSGSYLKDGGIDAVDDNIRASFRTGVSAQVNDKLDFTSSASFVSNYFTRDYNANTSFSRIGIIEGGRLGNVDDLSAGFLDTIKVGLQEEADNTDITESVRRFTTANTLNWKPFDGFTAKLTVGLDQRRSRQEELFTNALLVAKGSVDPGTANQGGLNRVQRDFLTVTTDLALQHRFDAGDFSFVSSAGGQLFREIDEQLQVSATNLVEGTTLVVNSADQSVDQFIEESTFGGFYFAENIGFQNKLFFDVGARFDANSAFGEEIGIVDLYRFGLVYSLTDEKFMQEGPIADIVTRASFRGNWGQASNFPNAFARDRLLAAETYNGGLAFTLGNPGNAALGPEITESIEVGGDFSFVDARIGLGFSYYNQTTTDALFLPPSVPSSGELAQQTNVGEISNEGVQINTYFDILRKSDLDLKLTASVTTVNNEVSDAGGAPPFNVGGFTFLGGFVEEGQPLGFLRGAVPNFEGDELVSVDRNQFLGNPTPDQYGSIGLDFRWKQLRFVANSDFQFGAQGVNVDEVLRFIRGSGDPARFPEGFEPGSNFFDYAGVWVEDADFYKIRNVAVFYTIPTVDYGWVKGVTVGFNAINPYAWASSTFDPEVTGSGIRAQGQFSAGGFGYGTVSGVKRYLFTVKATF